MMKKLGNTLIKVLSLGVGLAIGMVLIAKVCFELSYDKFYDNVEHIYQIRTAIEQQGQPNDFYNISGAVAPGFQEEVPGVLLGTRYTTPFGSRQYFDEEKNIIEAEAPILAADTCFFKIFNREFLIGDPTEILSSWNAKVVVSRSFAEKLGGIQESIGKVIANSDLSQLELIVSGVFEDFPENSTIRADVVMAIHAMGEVSINNWFGNDRYNGFVLLADGVDHESLTDAIHKMQETHQDLADMEKNGLKLWYYLSPFENQHRSDDDVRSQVVILSVIAFLLILISVLNYVLVAISDVIRRSREVGVRKCYGADTASIYVLLLREALINLVLSFSVAAAVIFAFRGIIEALTGVALASMMIPQTFAVLAAVLTLVFVASAVIPAQMFVMIPISSAFRGYKENKRRWKMSLLTFQFAINAFLVILVLVASSQYRLVTNEDVGYDPENIVYVDLTDESVQTCNTVVEKLRALPFVEGVERTYDFPMSYASGNNVMLPGDERQLFNIADQYEATEGFMDLMGFRMVDGTVPDSRDVIAVSRSFVDRMMQFEDWSDGAVGKAVRITGHSYGNDSKDFNADAPFRICGVFEDYRVHNAMNPDTRPIVRFYGDPETDYMPYAVLRLDEITSANMKAVADVVEDVVSSADIDVHSYEEDMVAMYDGAKKMKNTFIIGALVALLIAFFGLIGFIGDETARRSAEIAIRKVNGAQTREIVMMFVVDIMKLAAIAIVIGNIAAWFAAQKWLEQFAERVALGPWYFIAADAALLIIIIATVVFGSIRVARMNPTISLKKD